VLIGEPGAGKTAIVEDQPSYRRRWCTPVAQKTASWRRDRRIDGRGAKFRGEFEELKCVEGSLPILRQILFSTMKFTPLSGRQVPKAQMDASNPRPMLARGELRCIGATTHLMKAS